MTFTEVFWSRQGFGMIKCCSNTKTYYTTIFVTGKNTPVKPLNCVFLIKFQRVFSIARVLDT